MLYLLRGLLNILQNYTWESQTDYKVLVYTRVLALLSAISQDSYVYHADKGTCLDINIFEHVGVIKGTCCKNEKYLSHITFSLVNK